MRCILLASHDRCKNREIKQRGMVVVMIVVVLVVLMMIVVVLVVVIVELPTCQGYRVQQPEIDAVGHDRPAKVTTHERTYRKRRTDTS